MPARLLARAACDGGDVCVAVSAPANGRLTRAGQPGPLHRGGFGHTWTYCTKERLSNDPALDVLSRA